MASIHKGLERRLAAAASTVEPGPLQFTPPQSPAAAIFGTRVTTVTPRSAQDLMLAVNDVCTATA